MLEDAFLELQIKEQRVKLYIVPGVPTETPMCPQTRKEISEIGWIRLTDLPGYSKRKQKNVRPPIKMYMVTPFMSGLRTWISQNIHRRGMLLPVREEENNGIEEEGEARTSDGLVTMLRNSQSTRNGQVDLLSMLRNGTDSTDPMISSQPPSADGNDLLTMLRKTNGPLPSNFAQPGQSEDPRAQSLLNILKSPPPPESTPVSHKDIDNHVPTSQRHHHIPLGDLETSTLPSSVPTATPSTAHQNALLSALQGHGPVPPPPQTQTVPPAPPVSSHQSGLLSLLKSPKFGAVQPATATTHKDSLLAALKSPPIPKDVPVPADVRPASTSPSAQNVEPKASSSSHKDSLLARLKSPLIPKTIPVTAPPTQQFTSSAMPETKASSLEMHKDALLSALKSPPLPKAIPAGLSSVPPTAPVKSPDPETIQPPPVVSHQDALLSVLKGSAKPSQPAPAVRSHQSSLLAAFKSPPVPKVTPAPVATPNVGRPS